MVQLALVCRRLSDEKHSCQRVSSDVAWCHVELEHIVGFVGMAVQIELGWTTV